MSLDDFLAEGHERPVRCKICRNEKLAAEIKEFVDRKLAGTTHHSCYFIHSQYFAKKYDVGTFGTFMRHIRVHLKAEL